MVVVDVFRVAVAFRFAGLETLRPPDVGVLFEGVFALEGDVLLELAGVVVDGCGAGVGDESASSNST